MSRLAKFVIICLLLQIAGVVGIRSSYAAIEGAGAPSQAQVDALEADFERNVHVWRAFARKDYGVALELASPLAEQGSPLAQYIMGEMRFVGTEFDGDPAVAIAWFEQAASMWQTGSLLKLVRIYSTGYGGELDLARARITSVRWANSNAALARAKADKTKPFLFVHRRGEGPVHRFWAERVGYFEAYARAVDRSSAESPIPVDSQLTPMGKLPADCQPPSPPTGAMIAAKIDQFEGWITLMVNDSGLIEGMVVGGVSVDSLSYAALDVFQKALRSPNCVVTWPKSGRPIQIPFLFQLR